MKTHVTFREFLDQRVQKSKAMPAADYMVATADALVEYVDTHVNPAPVEQPARREQPRRAPAPKHQRRPKRVRE